jgi:hypothetical protein
MHPTMDILFGTMTPHPIGSVIRTITHTRGLGLRVDGTRGHKDGSEIHITIHHPPRHMILEDLGSVTTRHPADRPDPHRRQQQRRRRAAPTRLRSTGLGRGAPGLEIDIPLATITIGHARGAPLAPEKR